MGKCSGLLCLPAFFGYYIIYHLIRDKSSPPMISELDKLRNVWLLPHNKSVNNTELPQITFNDLTNSIISTGPFYYYVIDFYDMSLSHISPAIRDLHGFDPETVTFDDVLNAIHPDDQAFIAKAESTIADFFHKNIKREKLLKYKKCYNIRGRNASGGYTLFNHQALMLTLDSNGGYGKCLNIHTSIDHITSYNTYQYSLIGLNGEPSFMNINPDSTLQNTIKFSKREIDVLKCMAEGLNSTEIADKLFISDLTVKKHRKNILEKSECKNTAQLITNCVRQGLI